jgi:hypothetical protein
VCQLLVVVFIRSVHWLLVTANFVPRSLILVTLMMEALRSPETLVLTRAIQCDIAGDSILHVAVCLMMSAATCC